MKPANGHVGREHSAIPTGLLTALDMKALGTLVGLGTDIVMLVDRNDVIKHIHVASRDVADYGLARYVGRRLQDCVTIESVPKVEAMLSLEDHLHAHRGYQVNHEAAGKPDLPVVYSAYSASDFPYRVVVGRELRQQMSDQQRLVEAQMELEGDYRELQETEARYRTAFRISAIAQIMLDGEKKIVLDANAAAVTLLAANRGVLNGKPVRDLFNRQDHDRIIDALSEARHSPEPVRIDNVRSARGDLISVGMRSYRENGVTNLVLSVWPSAETTEVGQPAPDRQTPITAIDLADLPVAALQTDVDGVILAANTLFLDMVHAPALSQVIGRNVGTWFGKAAIDIHLLYARVFEEQFVRGFHSILTDNLQDERAVSLSARMRTDSRTVQLVIVPQAAGPERLTIPTPGVPDQAEGFASLVGKVPLKDLIRESLDVIEKICIEAALDQTGNNRAQAAEILGLSRQGLYIKLRRHGLEDYRPET